MPGPALAKPDGSPPALLNLCVTQGRLDGAAYAATRILISLLGAASDRAAGGAFVLRAAARPSPLRAWLGSRGWSSAR